MARRSKLAMVERERGQPIIEILKELYTQHGSQREVAQALGIAQSTLSQNLVRLRLKEKTILVEEKTA